MVVLLSGCQHKSVTEWNDQEIESWFTKSKWNCELLIKPDSSINVRLFVEQNVLNPTAWEAAFKFLKETNFDTIVPGRYELDTTGTYASVSDYTTKDSDTVHFEAHKKFIDIQYVPKGHEYIGITSLENIQTKIKEYNSEKDIEFFDKTDNGQRLADKNHFFVFFPSDGHKPCLKVDTNNQVRKIVIKIPFIEN